MKISVKLTERQSAWIAKERDRLGISVAEVVRRALDSHIDSKECQKELSPADIAARNYREMIDAWLINPQPIPTGTPAYMAPGVGEGFALYAAPFTTTGDQVTWTGTTTASDSVKIK